MPLRKEIFAAALLPALLAIPLTSPAAGMDGACAVGEVCALQSETFGCKDASLIKRWVDIYVDENRDAADRFIAAQAEAGQCAEFKPGARLRILRYLGMRRLEVQRDGETERFIILLK